jgi:(p)ppGpp synthase/HD superfamily hydrolase
MVYFEFNKIQISNKEDKQIWVGGMPNFRTQTEDQKILLQKIKAAFKFSGRSKFVFSIWSKLL